MKQKTNDYDMFIFREDNRERIDQSHVLRIKESIKARNLLEMRPILVNGQMEIIDGQHRLLAAKALGVDIYYEIKKDLTCEDVILMNNAKNWTIRDYLNFYCKNGFREYIKLRDFIKKYNLNIRVALNIAMGARKYNFQEYKEGRFIFSDESLDRELEICWETIDFIRKMNGYSPYTDSSRFWRALLKLVTHAHFDEIKWRFNLRKMVERFSSKATSQDYCRLMMDVYNWRNNDKVNLVDDL